MQTTPVNECPVCGGSGPVLYRELRDRVFQAPGVWTMRRCEGCGSLWLDPRLVDEDIPLAYTSYFTHEPPLPVDGGADGPAVARAVRIVRDVGTDHYIARRFGYSANGRPWGQAASLIVTLWPARRLDAEFKVMRLHSRDTGRLLDVGCGNGDALVTLAERGWDVRGVDFDADAVAVARGRGLNVDLGALAAQQYPDEAFDVVTMSHSLEHVPDPAAVLTEARRILRAGGRIMIMTPNAASLLHRRYGPDWQPLEPPRHLQIFTRAALVDMVSKAGFVAVDAATTARAANGVARAAWKFRKEGRWDMDSRPSFRERVAMEMVQQWEAWKVRGDPDAGEDLVVSAQKA